LVSAIIVTIGTKDYLRHCIDSLQAQSHPPSEIIVMDNSLNPRFGEDMRKAFPSVKICSNASNLYYGVSLNKGIDSSRGEFILCLNDDLVLENNFIEQALKGFTAENKVGMVSGKILRMDKKTLDSTGLSLSLWYSAEERGYGRKDEGRFDHPGVIFGVTGSTAFYRREMLEEIKEGPDYFDARMRMFYEDLDLSWRAHKRGWKAYYVPAAIAFHARGASCRKESGLDKPAARRYLNDCLHAELIKNRYLTVFKNAGLFPILAHLIPMVIYDFCAWCFVIFCRPNVLKLCLNDLRRFLRFRPGKQAQDCPPD
jgi:GT2 family glycosyltransferase